MDVIFGEEKKFCQRLVATAEGLFATVCLITRGRHRTAGSLQSAQI